MKKRKRMFLFLVTFFFLMKTPFSICAKNIDQEAAEEQEDYLEELTDSIDFTELDTFLADSTEDELTFSEVVDGFLKNGISTDSIKNVGDFIVDALLGEIEKNRTLLLEMILLAVAFSILKNFSGVFGASYISDLCFILVYCVLALMLIRSISSLQTIVSETITQSVDFMKMLVPAFCISMVFSSNVNSSAGFYQVAFLVIYMIEWVFLNVFLPMIHMYVLFVILNHFMEEEHFFHLTELFRELISKGIKLTGVVVLGLSVVQNLISPAKDRVSQGMLGRAVSVIPGVGNAVSGIGEVLLGTGIVVKNSIGAAGVVVLVIIGLVPLLKIVCLAFFYKLAAAITEPVTDKRISGCLKGMADGADLYLRLLGYCLLLFFIIIGLTTAATSFIY